MQKISKTVMHIWITIASLGAFVFSWVLLIHSPKPAPLAAFKPRAAQSAPADPSQLQPIPSLNDLLNAAPRSGSGLNLQSNTTTTFQSAPRLHSRGS